MHRQVELIYDFVRQSELLPRERFIDHVGGPVLLFRRFSLVRPVNEMTKTTKLEQIVPGLADLLEEQKKRLVAEAHDYRVYRLPSTETQWTIGRASTCEIVLAHKSISKAHARIAVGADQSLLVTDLGSKNGTFVEAKTALPDKPMLLWSKQTLRLGSLSVRFLSPPDFFDLLGSLVTS